MVGSRCNDLNFSLISHLSFSTAAAFLHQYRYRLDIFLLLNFVLSRHKDVSTLLISLIYTFYWKPLALTTLVIYHTNCCIRSCSTLPGIFITLYRYHDLRAQRTYHSERGWHKKKCTDQRCIQNQTLTIRFEAGGIDRTYSAESIVDKWAITLQQGDL
jgi:hypothetical protein